ncbi:malate dehydrogenase [Coprobacter tertius]|uniref:Malate dehydrogenase n=1 Tax=Coprobacter tertius TaxID=2944915 RepID=A0ABT1MI64_9BACT|nr:malate dehydrogenase [Coprobacter tertius]MCP9612307.1 malate dehydrogenase [Coprobacter tertius]
MKFLTDKKLTIVGAAGMIGSNMAQTAIMMKLTPNICLYDPYAPALEGVAEELLQCGFEGMNITYTSDIKEALTGAKYIVSSGGAARKAGMTREDLLKGNSEIAAQFGKDIRSYCPDVEHVVVVFNPADITGLITLLYSGLKPNQVSTLAALDSTRLLNELVKYLKIPAADIENCRTYGGHGEQMAVFASTTRINDRSLSDLIKGGLIPQAEWEEIKQKVIQGGKHIIELRGRSSFQSPAYLSIEMIAAAMGGTPFRWPAGVYVYSGGFDHIMMAMETTITKEGISYKIVKGSSEEEAELKKSYEHLCTLRDEVIDMGIIPPIKEWNTLNPHIK